MRLLGAAIGGATATGILWLIVNGWTMGAASRIVRELGWPVSSYWLASIVGAVVAVMGRVWNIRKKVRQSAANAKTAAEIGLTYSLTVERPSIALPCLEKWHCGKEGNTTEHDGLPVSVFDITERIDTGEGDSFPTRTIILIPAVGLPAFTSSPRWAKRFAHIFGFGGMTFSPTGGPIGEADTVRQFVRAIRIVPVIPGASLRCDSCDWAGDPDPWALATPESEASEMAVRRLITPTVMATLSGQQGWSFQAAAGWLACWRGQEIWPAEERLKRIATVSAVRSALLAAAADPSPVIVPPRMLPNSGQFLARGLGTLSGALLGLFGAFIVSPMSIMEALGLQHYSAALMIVPFLDTAVGVIVFGIMGFWIGVAVGQIPAISRWTPLPVTTPEQKAEKDRCDSWQRGCACLGFYAGGAAGIAVLIALAMLPWSYQISSAWAVSLFPILLTISGAIAGLIGGGVFGSWIARRRSATVSAESTIPDDSTRAGPV